MTFSPLGPGGPGAPSSPTGPGRPGFPWKGGYFIKYFNSKLFVTNHAKEKVYYLILQKHKQRNVQTDVPGSFATEDF